MKIRAGLILGLAAALTAPLFSLAGAQSAPTGPTLCGQYDTTPIQDGRYYVANNRWGDNTRQCIQATDTGFVATEMNHNMALNGPPGAYPSVVFGCHYTNCSKDSKLPMSVKDEAFTKLRTKAELSLPVGGVWNASYDLWFDPTRRTDGQVTGAEIMIWPAHQGGIQPIGAKVDTITIMGAKWDVWYGVAGGGPTWKVTSYVRQENATDVDFSVSEIYADTVKRGYAESDWYLTSIQAGFEPWVGEKGLSVKSFEVTSDGQATGGGGVIPSPRPEPTPKATPKPSVGPMQQPPAAGGRLCSSEVTVPLQWDGGYLISVSVTNGARAPHNAWASQVTLPAGQSVQLPWNGKSAQSSGRIEVTNEFYNGVLLPTTSTSWGAVVLRPRGSTTVLTTATCNLR